MLDRDTSSRLGSTGDINEVISHPFFKDVNFDLLQKKQVPVPYKPDHEQMTIKENEIVEM